MRVFCSMQTFIGLFYLRRCVEEEPKTSHPGGNWRKPLVEPIKRLVLSGCFARILTYDGGGRPTNATSCRLLEGNLHFNGSPPFLLLQRGGGQICCSYSEFARPALQLESWDTLVFVIIIDEERESSPAIGKASLFARVSLPSIFISSHATDHVRCWLYMCVYGCGCSSIENPFDLSLYLRLSSDILPPSTLSLFPPLFGGSVRSTRHQKNQTGLPGENLFTNGFFF